MRFVVLDISNVHRDRKAVALAQLVHVHEYEMCRDGGATDNPAYTDHWVVAAAHDNGTLLWLDAQPHDALDACENGVEKHPDEVHVLRQRTYAALFAEKYPVLFGDQ